MSSWKLRILQPMSRTGYYKGVLTYGSKYGEHAGKELQFDIRLIEEEGGTFFGESSDLEGFGINPFGAELRGVFVDKNIVFKKKYNRFHYMNESGETVFDADKEAPVIEYIGFYKEDKEQYEGKWKIKTPVKLLGIIPWTLKSKGSFILWLEMDEAKLKYGR